MLFAAMIRLDAKHKKDAMHSFHLIPGVIMWKMYGMSNWIGNNKRMEIWLFKQIFPTRFAETKFNAIHIFRYGMKREAMLRFITCAVDELRNI